MKLFQSGIAVVCTFLAIVALVRGHVAASTNLLAWAILNVTLAGD